MISRPSTLRLVRVTEPECDQSPPSPNDTHSVQEALEGFKCNWTVLNRPSSVYSGVTFADESFAEPVFNHENTLYSSPPTSPSTTSTSSAKLEPPNSHSIDDGLDYLDMASQPLRPHQRPRLLQTYTPIFRWGGGTELKVCKRGVPKPLDRGAVQAPRILVEVENLAFNTMIEPLFVEIALFDLKTNTKVSESCYFDLNSPDLLAKLGHHLDGARLRALERDNVVRSSKVVMECHAKTPSLFLFVKVFKVLQGDLKDVVAPYCKERNEKEMKKHRDLIGDVCNRLGEFRQLFAWGATPIFNEKLQFRGNKCTINCFFRQLRQFDGLTDEYVVELLETLVSNPSKLKPIPGHLRLKVSEVSTRQEEVFREMKAKNRALLNPFYKKLIPRRGTLEYASKSHPQPSGLACRPVTDLSISKESMSVVKEVLDFPSTSLLRSHSPTPTMSYVNCLYIYPLSVAFGDSRNVGVSSKLLNSQQSHTSLGLPVVYSRGDSGCFTDKSSTSVTYHNKSPNWGDEFKIELPRNLRPEHHILFEFFNVKCALQKSSKQTPVRTVLGYAFLPIFPDGRVNDGQHSLCVYRELKPNYLLGTSKDFILPAQKTVFRVKCRLRSTLYSSDPYLARFLRYCTLNPPCLGEEASVGFSTRHRPTSEQVERAKYDEGIERVLTRRYKEGFLSKKTSFVGGHSQFWFVLSDRKIVYFKANTSSQEEGSYPITSTLSIDVDSSDQTHPYTISLDTSSRKVKSDKNDEAFFISADSEEEMMSWIRALEAAKIRSADRSQSVALVSQTSPVLAVRFLPTILRLLFRLLCAPSHTPSSTTGEKVVDPLVHKLKAVAFRSLLSVCEIVHAGSGDSQSERSTLLDSFAAYAFSDEWIEDDQYKDGPVPVLAYSVICEQWAAVIASGDKNMICLAVQYSSFLFDIIIKSMVLQIERLRTEHSQDLVVAGASGISSFCDENVMSTLGRLVQHATSQTLKLPFAQSKKLNANLALFIRDLFYVLDREFVFDLIAIYLTTNASKDKLHSENKFQLLEIVMDHDHLLPLCRGAELKNHARAYFDAAEQASTDMPRPYGGTRQFLPMVLLNELNQSINSSLGFMLTRAASSLRRLLTKHSFDSRYQDKDRRAKVAGMYLPLLRDLWEKLPKIKRIASPSTKRDLLVCVLYILQDVPPKMVLDFLHSHRLAVERHHQLMHLHAQQESVHANPDPPNPVEDTAVWFCQFLDLMGECLNSTEYPDRSNLKSSKRLSPPNVPGQSDKVAAPGRKAAPEESILSPDLHGVPVEETLEKLEATRVKSDSSMQGRRWFPKQKGTVRGSSPSKQPTVSTHKKKPSQSRTDSHKRVRRWERMFASEAALIVLDAMSQVVMPFFWSTLLSSSKTKRQVVWLLRQFLVHNTSDGVLEDFFQRLTVMLRGYADALFSHGEPVINASRCKDWWYSLFRHGLFVSPGPRIRSVQFMHQLLKACYVQIGSVSRVRRPAAEAWQQIFEHLCVVVNTKDASTRDLFTPLRNLLHRVTGMVRSDSESLDAAPMAAFVTQVEGMFTQLANVIRVWCELHYDVQKLDAESKADLRVRLFLLYTDSPRMQLDVLRRLHNLHLSDQNFVEAALCHMNISKILRDENRLGRINFGMDQANKNILQYLKVASNLFEKADMPERSVQLEQELAELARQERKYDVVVAVHERLLKLQRQLSKYHGGQEVRIFGTYYRVGFLGKFFGKDDGAEYVYKEFKITRLSEITERLVKHWSTVAGKKVKVHPHGGTIDRSELDPQQPFLQITKVDEFSLLDDQNKDNTAYQPETDFELHTNLKAFVFSTPFVPGSNKGQGGVAEQHLRRNFLMVEGDGFPAMAKRLRVVSKTETVLAPVDVAISRVEERIAAIRARAHPKTGEPHLSSLNQVLSGSVNVMVGGGIAELCQVFLDSSQADRWDASKLGVLRKKIRMFFDTALMGIEVSGSLCSSEQEQLFQKELEKGYHNLKKTVVPYI